MKRLNRPTQVSFLLLFTAVGQPTVAVEGAEGTNRAKNDTSPVRNIKRDRDSDRRRSDKNPDANVRAIDGSDFLWQWGQFIDHDFVLADGVDPAEPANIPIPAGDPWFDPAGTGTQTMSFNRSIFEHDTGTGTGNPRAQLNEITGWIDASQVYGSDEARASTLRTNDGTGT